MKAKIQKIEFYLPSSVEDNSLLQLDNPEWNMAQIEEKTGIYKRHIIGGNELASDLGVIAAQKIFTSEEEKKLIDCLIFVTQSPDYALPTTACIVQNRLGLPTKCMAFDVNLGCSGYVYALALAASLIETSVVSNALIICSEIYSKYISKTNRTCRPIFSDGAAATLIVASTTDNIGPFDFGSDGSGAFNLMVKNNGVNSTVGDKMPMKELYMNGSEVFMFTMSTVPKTVAALLSKAQKNIDEVDLFFFHQASKLVISNITRHLNIPESKVFVNMTNIGNTVSASIPIALKDAAEQGGLKKGQLVMLVGFGVGYSWGSCLVEWDA